MPSQPCMIILLRNIQRFGFEFRSHRRSRSRVDQNATAKNLTSTSSESHTHLRLSPVLYKTPLSIFQEYSVPQFHPPQRDLSLSLEGGRPYGGTELEKDGVSSEMQTDARMAALKTGSGGNSSAGAAMDDGKAARKYHQQSKHIGAFSHFIAGGVAGAVSKTCTAPLARLTILFQVQGMHSDVVALKKNSMWREASRIAYEEGFRAFWKGNLVTIIHRLPYSSISFYTYDRYKNFLQTMPGLNQNKDYASADVCVRLLGGGLSGITAASITYPLDLVRTRLAAQTNNIYYRGISHALYSICRCEGVKGLYKGLGPTLMGVGPSIAISFSVYEILRSHWQLQRPHDSSALVSLACGSLSGVSSSTVTFPLDLVRRRKQLEGAGGRSHVYNSGLIGTFRHIIRTEGFRGLYRGILPEYCKVVPSVGIVFMTYETIKNFLSNNNY